MSATSAEAAAAPRGTSVGRRDIRPLLWIFSLAWMAVLAWGIKQNAAQISGNAERLVPWIVLILAMQWLPLPGWKQSQLIIDQPIRAAADVLLSPIAAGLVGSLTWLDPREFRGTVTPTKAIFNRCQSGASDFLASLLVHAIVRSPITSRFALPLALLTFATALATNYSFVASAIALEHRRPMREVIKRLPQGSSIDFGLSLAAWAVLAGMLTIAYLQIGAWALLAFVAPALLTRQVLLRSKMLVDTSQAYRSREQALAKISQQIRQERLDERRLIAADLHDEVLQPLFKVSLMGHVLKADLATGRLFELDQDLPELLTAAELAAGTLRDLIGDLRSSSLGRGGLSPALSRLVRSTGERASTQLHTDIAPISAPGDVELGVYQIAKEAMANALTHSRATNIWISLEDSEEGVCLTVRDDGTGFDPEIDREGHYGLHIMRERAAAIHGHLTVDTTPGRGCLVTLFIPRE